MQVLGTMVHTQCMHEIIIVRRSTSGVSASLTTGNGIRRCRYANYIWSVTSVKKINAEIKIQY